jgi:serine/threonine-protein kinase
VLPASVAGDPERLARFQREAEVLAALNHPNIAQVHGLEKSAPSAEAQPYGNAPTVTSPALTMPGVIPGTAASMSPEQAKGKTVDKRADIWAFGVILYEMVTGKPLFAGDAVMETLAAVVAQTPDLTGAPARRH